MVKSAVSRWRRNTSTVLVASIGFFDHIEYSVIVPSLWGYLQSFGVTEEWIFSFVFAAFSISVLVVAPIAGAYVDSFPMRGILLAGLLVSVGGQFMYAVAWNEWAIIASRLISGVGAATMSILMVYIARITTSENRTAWSARFNLIAQCGLLLGPAFAVLFEDLNFYIGPFLVNKYTAPGWLMMLQNALLFVLIALFFVEPSLGDEKSNPAADDAEPINTIQPASRFSLKEWFADAKILLNVATGTVCFIQFILFFNQMCMETVLTPLTDYFYDFTPLQNSLLYCGVVVVFAVVFLTIAQISPFVQDRTMILFGLILEIITLTFSTVIFSVISNPPFWMFLVGVTVFVAGLPFFAACIGSLLTKLVEPERVGTAQGILVSVSMVAQILGPLWAGTFSIAPVVVFAGELFLILVLAVVLVFTYRNLYTPRLTNTKSTEIISSSSETTPLIN